jgi:hypothetical protein
MDAENKMKYFVDDYYSDNPRNLTKYYCKSHSDEY